LIMTAFKLNTNILMLGDFITLKKGIMLVNSEQNTIKGKKGELQGISSLHGKSAITLIFYIQLCSTKVFQLLRSTSI
jgi:hypothetical protein